MKKMTEKQIEKAISNVRSTLAVENLKPSHISISYGRKYLRGEITSQEAIESIKQRILSKKEKLERV